MPSSANLPPDLFDRVQQELNEGETLLWTAQPSPARMMRRTLPMLVVAVPFTVFSLFFVAAPIFMGLVGGAATGAWGLATLFGLAFSLFGLVFVGIGLVMLFSPLLAWRAARQTAYAVTDQRAILFNGGFRRTTRSYGPDRLTDLERVERGDGSGDLIFDRQVTYHRTSQRHRPGPHASTVRPHVTPIGFFGIPQVREVDKLIRDLAVAYA